MLQAVVDGALLLVEALDLGCLLSQQFKQLQALLLLGDDLQRALGTPSAGELPNHAE